MTQLPLSGAGDEQVRRPCAQAHGRVRRHRLPRLRRASRQRTVEGVLRDALGPVLRRDDARAHVRRSHRRRRARVGPGGVAAGRRRATSTSSESRTRSTRQLGPEVVVRDAALVDARVRRPPRRQVAHVPLHDRQPARRPTRSWPAPRGGCRSRSTSRCCVSAPIPFLGEHDFATFCRKRSPADDDDAPRARLDAGTTSATACCATTSPPPRSAGRWCARSSARSSTSASGKIRPGEILGIAARRATATWREG